MHDVGERGFILFKKKSSEHYLKFTVRTCTAVNESSIIIDRFTRKKFGVGIVGTVRLSYLLKLLPNNSKLEYCTSTVKCEYYVSGS